MPGEQAVPLPVYPVEKLYKRVEYIPSKGFTQRPSRGMMENIRAGKSGERRTPSRPAIPSVTEYPENGKGAHIMYVALMLILLIIAVIAIRAGRRRGRTGPVVGGIALIAVTVLFFWFLSFWGEYLWFAAVGYGQRFWTVIIARAGLAVAGAAAGLAVMFLLTWSIPREDRRIKHFTYILGIVTGGTWFFAQWDIILTFIKAVSTGVRDPILSVDTGFYLFRLPFYDEVLSFLFLLTIFALIATAFSLLPGLIKKRFAEQIRTSTEEHVPSQKSFYVSTAALLCLIALWEILNIFHLMYSTWGVVSGPGWTDVHIRVPAYIATALIALACALVIVLPPLRNRLQAFVGRFTLRADWLRPFISAGVLFGIVILMSFLSLNLLPNMFQWMIVEPNEITYEKPYIAHNIAFTQKGFGLDDIEETEFAASESFTQDMVERNRDLFDNVRLWDWRALDAVYKQFQEIRLYYEFTDVDIDRYTFDDKYRQIMVSARELKLTNLPAQSQTFVNQRFKYTHGYGITLTTVSDFTPEGLPNLIVKDIPPKSTYKELEVKRPQIYYGQLTDTPAVVNTEEEELDYPSGEQNVYIRYPGTGGVQLSNIWRRFIYGWMFDGTRFFLSTYPTEESRIMFHRNIRDRVETLAPFLTFDDDPYIVLAEGKLYWIVDAYTSSSYFPYSEHFSSFERQVHQKTSPIRFMAGTAGSSAQGANYIRNSVKAVVDAFDGSVDYYVFDDTDPIIQVWQRVFPDLFKDRDAMPPALSSHVRYPSKLLLIQGLVYAKYHMTEPAVFYNQEDLWVRATEKYYSNVEYVDPYYIMWKLPDSPRPEFVLILPFTPKNRQVMIGWIAGLCDANNYGRLIAYKFPKEKRILGTQQVETKIDQDRFLSGQLSLWDQRGSNVIRGNVLVIPVEDTLLYVEPIYLQAETAAYPELRLVAIMHNDRLSYAESFDEALRGFFTDEEWEARAFEEEREEAGGVVETVDNYISAANDAFERYLRFIGEKRFQEASQALTDLQASLERLSAMTGGGKSTAETAPSD